MNAGNLRKHYTGMSDEDIEKANTMINYVICDKKTGEIVQHGDMDLLSFDKYIPTEATYEKILIPDKHAWKLRGEFVDRKGERMFKINKGLLGIKTEHKKDMEKLRMAEDVD